MARKKKKLTIVNTGTDFVDIGTVNSNDETSDAETTPETANQVTDSAITESPPPSESESDSEQEKSEKEELEWSRKQLKYYENFTNTMQKLRNNLSYAEIELKDAKEKVKDCQGELANHLKSIKKPYDGSQFPLFETKETSHPPTNSPPLIDVPETQETTEYWKKWRAKDYFDFTENEWGLLAPSEGTADNMTIADLIEFEKRFASGEKIIGFGKKKHDKLSEQFINFWEKHPELCFWEKHSFDVPEVDVSESGESDENDPLADDDQESDDIFGTESSSDEDESEDESETKSAWEYLPQSTDFDDSEETEESTPINVQLFLEEIDEMLNDGDSSYSYAEDTLKGIKENVEEYRSFTAEQKRAVKNIKNKPSPPRY
jgi:hypothetical protein